MPIFKETQYGNNPPTREVLPPGTVFPITTIATRAGSDTPFNGRRSVSADGNAVVVSGYLHCGVVAKSFRESEVTARKMRRETPPLIIAGKTLRQGVREVIIWTPER